MLTLDQVLLARDCAGFTQHAWRQRASYTHKTNAGIAVIKHVMAQRLSGRKEPSIGDKLAVDIYGHVSPWSREDIEATLIVYKAAHGAMVSRALHGIDLDEGVTGVDRTFNDIIKFGVTAVTRNDGRLKVYLHRWKYDEEDYSAGEQRAWFVAACVALRYELIDLVTVQTVNAITGVRAEYYFETDELPKKSYLEGYIKRLTADKGYKPGEHCANCHAIGECPSFFNLAMEKIK